MRNLITFIRRLVAFIKRRVLKLFGVVSTKAPRSIHTEHLYPLLQPKILIYSGDSIKGGGQNHMRMWVQSFQDCGIPFAILVRDISLYRYIRKTWPDVAIAYGRTSANVENIMDSVDNIKSVFYTSNAGNNVHLLRLNHLNHIFIGHGDSDKAGSSNKIFRAYDEVWAAGQAQVDRLATAGFDVGHLVIKKVGRPNLQNCVYKIDQLKKMPKDDRLQALSIMYLPTWEGNFPSINYCSLYFSVPLLTSISTITPDASLLFKLHPVTGQRDKSIVNAGQQITRGLSKTSLICSVIKPSEILGDHLLRANVFICDVSSVITECLAIDAPIFIYKPSGDNIVFSESKIPHEYYAYVFSSVEEFKTLFSTYISEGDTLAEQRAEARQYFFGVNETRKKVFQKEVRVAANGTN